MVDVGVGDDGQVGVQPRVHPRPGAALAIVGRNRRNLPEEADAFGRWPDHVECALGRLAELDRFVLRFGHLPHGILHPLRARLDLRGPHRQLPDRSLHLCAGHTRRGKGEQPLNPRHIQCREFGAPSSARPCRRPTAAAAAASRIWPPAASVGPQARARARPVAESPRGRAAPSR